MFDHFKNFPVELLWTFVAVLGGVARYLSEYRQSRVFDFGAFLANVAIAGFSGAMFLLLGRSLQMPEALIGVMSGVGGFMGVDAINFLIEYLIKKKIP